MNSFIANNKQFFSLMLSLLLSSSLSATTVSNEPVSETTQDGETVFTTGEIDENYGVILEMQNGRLEILKAYLRRDEVEHLNEEFKDICENTKGSFKTNNFSVVGRKGNYRRSYLLARERIDLQLQSTLNFEDCLVESPQVDIAAKKVNFQRCFFVNPGVLTIVPSAQDSDYESIQIIFHDQPKKPTYVSGKVNLQGKETKKRLAMSNVKQVRFKLKRKS